MLVEKAHGKREQRCCARRRRSPRRRICRTLGVDAVIAQGAEAGGHRGTYTVDYRQALIGTMALVPQIVDAVSVPVIAAGGIMDARGLVASLSLGASAVQMGTAFLGCPEAPIPDAWKRALRRGAGRLDHGHRGHVRQAGSRHPQSLHRRGGGEDLGEALLPYPAQYSVSRELRKAAAAEGKEEFLALWSGQGVGLIREQPAAELVADLVTESRELMGRLAGD